MGMCRGIAADSTRAHARRAGLLVCCLALLACSAAPVQPEPAPPPPEPIHAAPVVEAASIASPDAAPLPALDAPAGGAAEVEEHDELPSEAPQAPGPPTRRQLCARPDEPDANMVDDMQVVMEENTCAAALWLDGLFGETQNLQSARKTSGYLETSVRHSEFEGTDEKVRFRVRVRLPNLKNRVSAVIGRDNEDDVVRDRTERFAVRSEVPRLEEDESWLAGLGYAFPSSETLKIDSRIGVAGFAHPRVYVQQRARLIAFADKNDLVYLRGTAFWTNEQGFGTTAGFDYTRVLSERVLLRFADVATISEKTEGLDWFSGVILYHHLREERGLAYELLIRGQTDEPEPLYEYGARIVYRHPILPRRLYAELLTGYSWPRVDPTLEREGSAQVGLSLELPFGRDED